MGFGCLGLTLTCELIAMSQYTISAQAYFKLFFHAAKHPQSSVNGVLLGKEESSGKIIVVDAIPLLHHWTSLSPMMEIGLDLAGRHAASSGLSLVGYYQACERIADTALAPVGERVAGKLKDGFKDAVAFVIDGDKIHTSAAALIPYVSQGTAWRPYSAEASAFTAGSAFQLSSTDIPQRAIKLVREEGRHKAFGDFDDHLEDVTIVTDSSGFITHFQDAKDSESQAQLASEPCILLPKGHFIVPSFVDLHLHAPQFLYQGNGLHLPLMEWLNEYAFKAEERLDGNPMLARKVYARLAQRLIQNGTGTVLLFGTIKEEINLILAEVMQAAGVRAFVGKLSMDMSSRLSYIESSTQDSLRAANSFVKRCRDLTSILPTHKRLVEPVLTPRFVPTCSDELLVGLGKLSATENLRIQSHLAEAHDQVEYVRNERGVEDIQSGLMTPRTIQAHCTFLDVPSFQHVRSRGTAIAHCPLSNAYFSAEPFRLREALDEGVEVGLGTDVAGGYSLDLMSSMRHAVSTSRMRQGSNIMTGADDGITLAINWQESLYLATKGGATALGLNTGVFTVGSPFDAQEICIFDLHGSGVGALDFFDLETTEAPVVTLEMVEKWWCIGDVRNRAGMWVQGVKLDISPL
ncbi:Metallo-dependent hydrolase [Mycena crocata]|nr:Metallo-dependent hydrolase [Mycena crocata]